VQSGYDQNPSFLSPAPSPSPAQAQAIQKSGRGIATTGVKNLYRIQTEENKILEPDDIQCDLDEDFDDEHYSV
jgi:hypothetical protein